MTTDPENPYVGPRTFEEEDGRFFYGREVEARTLLSSVLAEPLLLFYSQSGAGKSSLINTRLIPGLREAGFAVLPVGRVGGGLPGEAGRVDNVFTFNLVLSVDKGRREVSELATVALASYLQEERAAAIAAGEMPGPRVLIIDQFEEILSSHQANWQQRGPFFEQLAQALAEDDLLWVVLVMREDYVAALDPYLHLLPERLRHRFYMQRMDIASAQEAIEKPAELAGRTFAPGVARALVDNLRQIRAEDPLVHERALGQFIEPVQLQVVCYQLWQRLGDRPDAEITLRDLEELGDVDTALAHFYEQAIATVLQRTTASEIQLRNWFERQLITEAGTRGTVFHGTAETAGLDNEIVTQLADQFILRAEMRAGGLWYELVHDRFVSPILQANQAWRAAQDPLIRAAEEWDRSGRAASFLFQELQLQEALAHTDPDQAEPIVRDFLVASQDAQNQRAVAAARDKAAADERRAQEEARRAKRLRRITGVLVLALLFAVAGAAWAAVQTGVARTHQAAAESDSTRAVQQSMIANAESTRAVEQRLIAGAESTRAIDEEQRARAESTRAAREQVEAEAASTRAIIEKATADAASTVAAAEQQTAEAEQALAEIERATADAAQADTARQGQLLLAQSLAFAALDVSQLGDDTELATLLALEAMAINQREAGGLDASAATALLSLLARPYFNVTLRSHEGAAYAVAFSPSGELLASAGEDSVVRLWSLHDPLVEPALLAGHDGPVRALLFAGEDTLLSAGDDAVVRAWSLGDSAQPVSVVQEESAIYGLALAPNGRQLITSLESGTVHLWDLDEPEDGSTVLSTWPEPGYRPVVYQQGEGGLLVGNPSGALQAWRGANIFAAPTFIGQAEAPVTAVGAAAGDSAFAAADGSIRIRRQAGIDVTLAGHEGAVNALALIGDGQMLASGGEDGTVRFWAMPDLDATTTTPQAILSGHDGPVRAVSFAPDDSLLASAGADGTIRLWRLAPAFEAVAGGAPVLYSPDGERIVTVTQGGEVMSSTVHVWNTASPGQLATELVQTNGAVRSAVLSPDSRLLILGLDAQGPGVILPWQFGASSPAESRARWVDYPVLAVALSPDGELLAAAGAPTGEIELYQLDELDGSRAVILEGHRSAVTELAFTPDGAALVSAPSQAAEGDGIRLWSLGEISSGNSGASQILTPGVARALAVAPDSSRVAVAQDGVYLWSLDDLGAPPRLLPNSVARTNALAFSDDGVLLLAGGDGARLWQLDAPDALPVSFEVAGLQAVAFEPGSHAMLLGTSAHTYRLPALDDLPQLACAQVRRNLTRDEWQTHLPGEPYRATCPGFPASPDLPNALAAIGDAGDRAWSVSVTGSNAVLLLVGGLVLARRRQKRKGER